MGFALGSGITAIDGSGILDESSPEANDQRRSRNYRADIDGMRAIAVLPSSCFTWDLGTFQVDMLA